MLVDHLVLTFQILNPTQPMDGYKLEGLKSWSELNLKVFRLLGSSVTMVYPVIIQKYADNINRIIWVL